MTMVMNGLWPLKPDVYMFMETSMYEGAKNFIYLYYVESSFAVDVNKWYWLNVWWDATCIAFYTSGKTSTKAIWF